MVLIKRLDEDYKSALKASDSLKVSVLRMIKSSMKYQQIEKGHELSDEEVTAVISSLAKKAKESIEQFSSGGREELARKESDELAILQSYLPKQLGQADIDVLIRSAIAEVSATGEKDMGNVMRVLMPKIKGLADGKAVNNRVRELLA